jgi:hypothetical protein
MAMTAMVMREYGRPEVLPLGPLDVVEPGARNVCVRSGAVALGKVVLEP